MNADVSPKSLGLVPIPQGSFEHDLSMLERFQDFSGELLRMALLGITAIGFAVSQVLLAEEQRDTMTSLLATARPWLMTSLVLFAVAAATALWHRYASADSLAWHLQAMRRYQRNRGEDGTKADAEVLARLARCRRSQMALRISAASLALGATAFACGAIAVL